MKKRKIGRNLVDGKAREIWVKGTVIEKLGEQLYVIQHLDWATGGTTKANVSVGDIRNAYKGALQKSINKFFKILLIYSGTDY